MGKTNKRLLLSIVFALLLSSSVKASPMGDLNHNLNYGGAILNHDMMMMRDQQMLEDRVNLDNFHEDKAKKHKAKTEKVIKDNTQPEEKIYDSETSQELKQKQEELKNNLDKKKSKRRFFNRKNKNNEKLEPAEVDIEEVSTDAVIKGETQKNALPGQIFVKAIGVTNSAILSDYEIQQLTDKVIGRYVTFEDLEHLVQDFNYLYAAKGFVTAKAFLPPQTIKDGIVKINLVEGYVGEFKVQDNKYTSSSYIKKRFSQKEDDLFQIVKLEEEVVKFNKYNDGIKLKANLDRGKKQGTTDITLVAEEKFPFHVVGVMDNAGRKTIGELRGGLMLYSDSLFKQRDRLTLGSYVSRYSVTPFADYNIPVNKYDGRVGVLFSSSFTKIGRGPYEMFDISSKSYNYSLYYTHPLIRKPTFELNSYSAINYKIAATEFAGYEINKDQITSAETALNARWDTKRGIWYINQGVYHAFPIIDEASRYFKYTGSLTRLHDFGHGIVGQFRGFYQYSPQDIVPYIDQFQAGGLATVRGYSEGLLIGRSGYVISAEVMFPIAPQQITVKSKYGNPKKVPFVGKYVKGIVFADHAGVYPFKGDGPGAQVYHSSDYMISLGIGLRIQLPGDMTARLYWGFPLMHNEHEAYYRNPRFSFSLSFAPDFDKLLKYRRTLKENKNKENI